MVVTHPVFKSAIITRLGGTTARACFDRHTTARPEVNFWGGRGAGGKRAGGQWRANERDVCARTSIRLNNNNTRCAVFAYVSLFRRPTVKRESVVFRRRRRRARVNSLTRTGRFLFFFIRPAYSPTGLATTRVFGIFRNAARTPDTVCLLLSMTVIVIIYFFPNSPYCFCDTRARRRPSVFYLR